MCEPIFEKIDKKHDQRLLLEHKRNLGLYYDIREKGYNSGPLSRDEWVETETWQYPGTTLERQLWPLHLYLLARIDTRSIHERY
eukprot:COSAG01_NODE_11117_length_2004_cov_1.414173_1_plen_84_part_00